MFYSNKCIQNLTKPCLFILALIIIYSIILNATIKTKNDDPLIQFRSTYLSEYLNGWTISHFIFFAYIGYYHPTCEKEAFVIGSLWELFEWTIGTLVPILFPEFAFKIDPFWTSWYYGKFEDIVMNWLGFKFGQFLVTRNS